MGPDDIFIPTNFTDYTVEVYRTFTAFPEQGEPGRFYVDASEDHTYIWSNDSYAVVPNSFRRSVDSMPRYHSVDSMPRYHTRLSVPNMADMEFAPLNFETPTMTAANGFDTDGDIAPSQLYGGTDADTGPINIVQNGAVDAAEIAQSTTTFAATGLHSLWERVSMADSAQQLIVTNMNLMETINRLSKQEKQQLLILLLEAFDDTVVVKPTTGKKINRLRELFLHSKKMTS